MTEKLIAGGFFILCGAFSILSCIKNWDFFFRDLKALPFVRVFGRTGARIFYSLIGVSLIIVGIWIYKN